MAYSMLTLLAPMAFFLYLLHRLMECKRLTNTPGIRETLGRVVLWGDVGFSPSSVFWAMRPFAFECGQWRQKPQLYSGNEWDIHTNISFFPGAATTLDVRNLDVFQEVIRDPIRFPPFQNQQLESFAKFPGTALNHRLSNILHIAGTPALNDRTNWSFVPGYTSDSDDPLAVGDFGELTRQLATNIILRLRLQMNQASAVSRVNLANDDEDDEDSSFKPRGFERLDDIATPLYDAQDTFTHTLCRVFAMLALYPHEQERLFLHVEAINASARPTSSCQEFIDYRRYQRSVAVLYETLRLFALTPSILRRSAVDTTVTATDVHGGKLVVPVPQGSVILAHPAAIHYNERYWRNARHFSPDRFMKADCPWNAFVALDPDAWSHTHRGFEETLFVAVINSLISRFKITVLETPQFAEETFPERRRRVMGALNRMNRGPAILPLQFQRR